MEQTCNRCLGTWDSYVEVPKRCRWCGNKRWNQSKVRKRKTPAKQAATVSSAAAKPEAKPPAPLQRVRPVTVRTSRVESDREKLVPFDD